MNKIIWLVLLAGGLVLVVVAINGRRSLNADVGRFFSELLTNKAVWLLRGGAVAAAMGLAAVWHSPNPKE